MTTSKETNAKPATAKKAPAKKTAVKKTTSTKKPATKKTPAKKVTANPEALYKMTEVAAYYIAMNDGFRGSPTDYWIQAEIQIKKLHK